MNRKTLPRLLGAALVIVMLLSFLPITSLAAGTPSGWAKDEVDAAVSAGLVTDSVRADYQASITREQFCEIVVLAYEKITGKTPAAGNVSFTDTANAEILKAANLGIVNGVGDSRFDPDAFVTREQIAAMIVRMIDAAVPGADIDTYNNNTFADRDSISSWALPSVNYAYDNGIMQGTGNNNISPKQNTTCEQAVLLIYRVYVQNEDLAEFNSKTVNDYGDATVINYDGDISNNYAVLEDGVDAVASGGSVNTLVSEDADSGVYEFANIDGEFTSLESGDKLYIEGADGDIAIMVASVSYSGDTVTIQAGAADLSDFFDTIKIDMDIDYDLQGDEETGSGVTLLADVGQGQSLSPIQSGGNAGGFTALADAGAVNNPVAQPSMQNNFTQLAELKTSYAFKIDFEPSDGFKIEGELKATMTAHVEIAFDKGLFGGFNYFEAYVKFSSQADVSVSCKVDSDKIHEIKLLPDLVIPTPVAGLVIKGNLVFNVTAKAKAEIKTEIELIGGFRYSAENGLKNLSKADLDPELSVNEEVEITIGPKLEVKLVYAELLTAKIGAGTGIKVKGEDEIYSSNPDDTFRNPCVSCIDGEIDGYRKDEFSLKIGFGKLSITPVDLEKEFTFEIGDFYCCKLTPASSVEFGWGTCPYIQYLVTVTVTDAETGEAISGAAVTVGADKQTTDSGGTAKLYESNGDYTVSVEADRYGKSEAGLTIKDEPENVDIKMNPAMTDMEGDTITIESVVAETDLRYGSAATFHVTVNYSMESINQGVLMIGFNTDSVDLYEMLTDEDFIVGKGSGNHEFVVRAAPVNWGTAGDFSVYVNLSAYPHADRWTPLAYDVEQINMSAGNS